MPIKIQSDLPVKEILEKENIFVMDESRASHQDIRPIQILILNLMPLKVHEIDPKAFVNIIKTDYINGRFYQKTDY